MRNNKPRRSTLVDEDVVVVRCSLSDALLEVVEVEAKAKLVPAATSRAAVSLCALWRSR